MPRMGHAARGREPEVHLDSPRQRGRVSAPFHGVIAPDQFDSSYTRRIRIASEVATWGMAGVFVASAALPATDELSRLGLLLTAGLCAVFATLWFHAIPERVFGQQRFTL